MRRKAAWALIVLLAALAAPIAAQREGEAKPESGEKAGHGNMQIWAWINFGLLAGGLGYLIGKNAGPFFDARSRQIRKEMAEAEEQRAGAEARAAAVAARLANLQSDIEALRQEAQQEGSSEVQRIHQETAAELAKIQAHAEQEIAAAAKAARLELKRYSAELALGLAEQKVREQITPETQDALVQSFVQDLAHPRSPSA